MDKKKTVQALDPDDIKGFEEFLEGEPKENSFLPRPSGVNASKKEVSFEHFTFLANDATRLGKINELLTEKIPFLSSYDQSQKLIQDQLLEVKNLRKGIFDIANKPNSFYRKSLIEIFDNFFEKPKD